MASAGYGDRTGADGEEEEDVSVKKDQTEPSRMESCLDQPSDSIICEVVTYSPSTLPAKDYDPDTTEPISSGLRKMEELLSWKRSEANPFNVASVPLAPREPPLASSTNRTLVSHDMKGGYLDDRFIQGAKSATPYAFYHWNYIDVFNYFTHQLVTVPPVVWTNAAHKHGVVVLGTFITEWEDGAAMCEEFLKDEESYRAVADKLVQISHCYGFDGWLINIENPLSEVAVKNMLRFLRYLTDQMHERVCSSLILWYDSVTVDGKLMWQNEVNQSNRMFFNACDGIFTNYNWTAQSLEDMTGHCGGRQADVYVGVDVFARGKVVGGMFETNKALELIRRHNFSTAIFAPGWVYEMEDDKSKFRKNQDKFWALLSDFLSVHRLVSPLPFISSFCQGFGKAVYWRGQQETTSAWFNLTAQEIQPLYYHVSLEGGGWLRSAGCPEDAWNGGCSLLLDGLIPATRTAPVSAKLFSLHVPLASKTLVTFIYKASADISVFLKLEITDSTHCTHVGVQEVQLSSVSPEQLDDGHELVNLFSQRCPSWNPAGWTVRCSLLELRGCILREVCVNIQRDGASQDTQFNCRLGEIMLQDVAGLQEPPPLLQGLCVYDVVWLRGAGISPDSSSPCLHLNATLRWDYPLRLVRHFRVYWRRLRGPDPRVPPGQLQLVDRAYSNLFRVTELEVPEPPCLLELVVEPVVRTGLPVPESHWGRRSLSYTEDVPQ
ncbi:cytosolic endo-beta-N-acetylglucosaminidase isoform X1 [Embiotoca jacksoni]|uniref:cytosolic endo-beta-N-acetylglucosaminidase isoform X1 n=1 Tax=Embiotoca jacksoni TaxID=100190 RepID=UPI003704A645